MSFDTFIPRDLITLVYVGIATFLGWVGGWIARRKREPVELDKVRAETRNIHVTAENAQVGIGLETLREIQLVIEKAERRREEWQQREDQMRTQIVFWRNKAEELDGELIDERYEHAQTQTRLRMKTDDLEKAMGIIKGHHLSFAELDTPREKRSKEE